MLIFRNILIVVFVVFGYEMSAFTPKVSCLNEPLPLFKKHGKDFTQLCFEKPKDPIPLEMIKISRENIKNLPDEVDFGNLSLEESNDLEKVNKYKIFNFVFESVTIKAGLEIYECMDSITVFPTPSNLGNYNSEIIFKWDETDPATEIVKHYKKTLKLKANIVENVVNNVVNNITGISEESNEVKEIKEIWYDNNILSNYEDFEDIEGSNLIIENNGVLNIVD